MTTLIEPISPVLDQPDSAQAYPCRELDPELWFAQSPAGVERAKALCQPCPVRERCLADALGRGEPWGVWGGQLLVSGVVVARKRGRGRPPKVQAATDVQPTTSRSRPGREEVD